MQVIEDEGEFDRHQLQLVREIARLVKQVLDRKGVAADLVPDLTEQLTFQLATLLDGDSMLEFEGRPFVPAIAFALNDERTQVLGAAGGSWMHEYAIGIAESVCAEGG